MTRPRVIWLILNLVFGLGMSAFAGAMIANSRSTLANARRVYATGSPVRCVIVSKRAGTTSRRTHYHVTLQRRDRPELPAFERRVTDDVWEAAKEGTETDYYLDPRNPEAGVAEIERSHLEDDDVLGMSVFMVLALAWTGFAAWDGVRKKKR